ncbi:hypothetical protein BT69DRAFT_1290183 [Atractiella rhizophila]|nr:hypothetical protein BT69DRAFT_1290183 [Atractiella rhizophila]
MAASFLFELSKQMLSVKGVDGETETGSHPRAGKQKRERNGSALASSISEDPASSSLPPLAPGMEFQKATISRTNGNSTNKRLEPLSLEPLLPHPNFPTLPRLKHALERCLTNPGLHMLVDPRTDVDWDVIGSFTKPSCDKKLLQLLDLVPVGCPSEREAGAGAGADSQSKEHTHQEAGPMFVSSTSQVGGPLEQIFISLSRAGPNYSMLKHASFRESKTPFGSGALKPAAVELVWIKSGGEGEGGGRDADAMPGVHWFNMLSKFRDKFDDYLLTRPKEKQPEKLEHVYHYSRLDSWNPNLPKAAFDVKTRAVMPLRIDPMNYQPRLGNMDGIFCAHHNGKRWFGFQYIPLEDMDAATCGSVQQAEQAFGLCTALLERVLVEATAMFPRENVRLVFDGTGNRLAVFVNPSSDPDKRVCMRIKTESYLNGRHVGRDVSFTNFADGGSLDGIEWTVKMSIEVESEVKTVKRRHDLMLDKVARSHFLPPDLLDEEVEMALEGVEEQVWIGTREKRNRIMLLPGHSYTNDPPRMVHEIRQLSLKAYNQATGKKNEIVDPDMERELPPHLAYKAASRSSDSPPPVSTSSQNEKVPSPSTDNAASNIGSSSAHRDASTGSFESSVATEDISSSSSHNENVTDSDQVTPLSPPANADTSQEPTKSSTVSSWLEKISRLR